MNWRDLFYFSQGERRALTLLLFLITVAWIILMVTEPRQPLVEELVSKEKENQGNPTLSPIGKTAESEKVGVNSASTPQKSLPQEPRIATPKKLFGFERIRAVTNQSYRKTEKYPAGTVIELNRADTTMLKKVPGIGSAFARRIVKYRNLLGGFCCIEQLGEVYGIDEERYNAMKSWFSVDSSAIYPLKVNQISRDSLIRHPYLSYKQARVIRQLLKQKSRLSGWENLQLLEEFTEDDRGRLAPYLSFE